MGCPAGNRQEGHFRRPAKKKKSPIGKTSRRSRTGGLQLVGFQKLSPSRSSRQRRSTAISDAQKLIDQVSSGAGTPAERWDSAIKEEPLPALVWVEVVEQLGRAKRHEDAVEALQAAIRHNQGQAWMYSVLPLEMKLAERPQAEIDRALLSRLDFASDDIPQMLVVASVLSRLKSWKAAMEICREASRRDPWQAEIWMLAKSIADRSGEPDYVLWSRTGILRYVWTRDAQIHHKEAKQALIDLLAAARKSGPQELVSRIEEERRDALTWDLSITAQWAGGGDVDLAVHEPNGMSCDRRNKITKNGGVLSRLSGAGSDRETEEYRCQKAPNGDYEVVLSLIRGRVVTGHVVLEVTRYSGTDFEHTTRLRVPVGKRDGRVKVPVRRGRGKLLKQKSDD